MASPQRHRHCLTLSIHTTDDLGRLVASIRKGRIAQLRRRLRAEPAAAGFVYEGRTLLHHCVLNRRHEAADLLLQHGASPDAADADGWAPLHDAVAADDDEAVSLLLGAKARPAIPGPGDWTPLHEAFALGHEEAFCALVCALEEIDENAEERWMQVAANAEINYAVRRADVRALRESERRALLAERAAQLCEALVHQPLCRYCTKKWQRWTWVRRADHRLRQQRERAVCSLMANGLIQSIPRVYFRRLRLYAPLSAGRRADAQRRARLREASEQLAVANAAAYLRALWGRFGSYPAHAAALRKEQRDKELARRLQVLQTVSHRAALRLRRRCWVRLSSYLEWRRGLRLRRQQRNEMLASVLLGKAETALRRREYRQLCALRRARASRRAVFGLAEVTQRRELGYRWFAWRMFLLRREQARARQLLKQTMRSEREGLTAPGLAVLTEKRKCKELWRTYLRRLDCYRGSRKAARWLRKLALGAGPVEGSLRRHQLLRYELLARYAAMRIEQRRILRARQGNLADALLPRSLERHRRRAFRCIAALRRRRLLRARQREMAASLERRNAAVVTLPRYRHLAELQRAGAALRRQWRRRVARQTNAELLLRATQQRQRRRAWHAMAELAALRRRARRESLRQQCAYLAATVAGLESERAEWQRQAAEAQSEARAMEIVYRQVTGRAAGAREDAARLFQRCWRGQRGRAAAAALAAQHRELCRRAAQIQRCYRKGRGKMTLRQLRSRMDHAVRVIQRSWRRYSRCILRPFRVMLELERRVVLSAEELARKDLRRRERDGLLDRLQPAAAALRAAAARLLAEQPPPQVAPDDDSGSDAASDLETVQVRPCLSRPRPQSAAAVARRESLRSPQSCGWTPPVGPKQAAAAPVVSPCATSPSVPDHARWACAPSEWAGDQLFAAHNMRRESLPRRPRTASLAQQTDWSVLPTQCLPFAADTRQRPSTAAPAPARKISAFDRPVFKRKPSASPPRAENAAPEEGSEAGSLRPGAARRLAQRRQIGERPATCGSARTPLRRGFRCELPPL